MAVKSKKETPKPTGPQKIEEQDLISFTREYLAGYKLPKQVLFVDEVMRAPNGKANYKWAKETAEKELT